MEDQVKLLNINVGVLGHVDRYTLHLGKCISNILISGKTSLVKALSTSLSTAALDKNPQSQRRGITLDLGFSSFAVDIPDHLSESLAGKYDKIQFTLVDCPGHASLIRTIIGGAQIIDMIVLVIDINKGIQTQTAECIVIGEITTDKMIIVLNKVDMIQPEDRESKIKKMTNKIRKVFSATKFSDAPIVLTSAAVGGEKVASVGAQTHSLKASKGKSTSNPASEATTLATIGIPDLMGVIQSCMEVPNRNVDGPFYFSIDHCFAIKGHGTVLTGTVLSGSVQINSTIELPELQMQKKVKSMQMFHKPVRSAQQGDRVGMCVTNLESSLIERGIATTPGTVTLLSTVICLVRKVRFFKHACKSGSKFHISIGHTTVTATATFFGAQDLQSVDAALQESRNQLESGNSKGRSSLNASYENGFPDVSFDWSADYEYQDTLLGSSEGVATSYRQEPLQWMLLQFQSPVYCSMGSLIIASKLEAEAKDSGASTGAGSCRLAFYGPLKASLAPEFSLDTLRLFRWKQKICEVHRPIDIRADGACFEAIGWKLYSKNASIKPFLGLKLEKEDGEVVGLIHGPFGSTDKFKIRFPNGVFGATSGMKLILRFKRYVYDSDKTMKQRGIEFVGGPVEDVSSASKEENSKLSDNDRVAKDMAVEVPEACVDAKPNRKPTGGATVQSASPALEVRKTGVAKSMSSVTVQVASGSKEVAKPALVANGSLQTPHSSDTGKVQSVTNSPKKTEAASRHSIERKEENSPDTHASAGMAKYVPLDLSSVGIKKAVSKSMKSEQGSRRVAPPSTPLGSSQAHVTVESKLVGVEPKSNGEVARGKALPPPPSNPSEPTASKSAVESPPSDSNSIRSGSVESVKMSPTGENVAIVVGAFKKEENIRKHIGAVVMMDGNVIGNLIGPFAKLGKCKVNLVGDLEVSPGNGVQIMLTL